MLNFCEHFKSITGTPFLPPVIRSCSGKGRGFSLFLKIRIFKKTIRGQIVGKINISPILEFSKLDNGSISV